MPDDSDDPLDHPDLAEIAEAGRAAMAERLDALLASIPDDPTREALTLILGDLDRDLRRVDLDFRELQGRQSEIEAGHKLIVADLAKLAYLAGVRLAQHDPPDDSDDGDDSDDPLGHPDLADIGSAVEDVFDALDVGLAKGKRFMATLDAVADPAAAEALQMIAESLAALAARAGWAEARADAFASYTTTHGVAIRVLATGLGIAPEELDQMIRELVDPADDDPPDDDGEDVGPPA